MHSYHNCLHNLFTLDMFMYRRKEPIDGIEDLKRWTVWSLYSKEMPEKCDEYLKIIYDIIIMKFQIEYARNTSPMFFLIIANK